MDQSTIDIIAAAAQQIDIASLPLLDGALGHEAGMAPTQGVWDAIVILVTWMWEL